MKRSLSIILILSLSVILLCSGSVFAATAEQAGYESPIYPATGLFDQCPVAIDPDSYLVVGDYCLPIPLGWEASMVETENSEHGVMVSPTGFEIHLDVYCNDDPANFDMHMYAFQSKSATYGEGKQVDNITAYYIIRQLMIVDFN